MPPDVEEILSEYFQIAKKVFFVDKYNFPTNFGKIFFNE